MENYFHGDDEEAWGAEGREYKTSRRRDSEERVEIRNVIKVSKEAMRRFFSYHGSTSPAMVFPPVATSLIIPSVSSTPPRPLPARTVSYLHWRFRDCEQERKRVRGGYGDQTVTTPLPSFSPCSSTLRASSTSRWGRL